MLGFLSYGDWRYLAWFFLLVGIFNTIRFLLRTGLAFAQTCLIPGIKLEVFGAKSGAWAVITGSSDGIGREFALQLAEAGFHVLLVARNIKALQEVANEIVTKHGVSAKIHVIDFAIADEEAYAAFSNDIKDFDIGVLVNNVGKGHSIPADFTDIAIREIQEIITVNVQANLRVTHTILPLMIKRNALKAENRSLIINVGSMAGAVPMPMIAAYSASKIFMGTFSTALATEVKKHNIIIEHLNTYYVVSKLSSVSEPSLFVPTPDVYVSAALAKIGLACGAAHTGRPNTSTPFWPHALLDWYINLIPGSPGSYVQTGLRMQEDLRKKALIRQAWESKKET